MGVEPLHNEIFDEDLKVAVYQGRCTQEVRTEEAPTEEARTEEAPTEEARTEEAPTEEARSIELCMENRDISNNPMYDKNNVEIRAVFKMNGKNNNKSYFITRSFLPTFEEKSSILKLAWSIIKPSLLFRLHRSEYNNTISYLLNIQIDHAIWGLRSYWLDGLHHIIHQLELAKDSKSDWIQQKDFRHDVDSFYNQIRKVETEIFDCDEAQQFLWKLATGIIESFAVDENSAFISPKFSYSSPHNFDMPLYRPGKLPDLPLRIDDDFWINYVWNECLDWNSPKVLFECVKNYWITHPSEDAFLKMKEVSKGGWKGTWDAHVDIMIHRPESEQMIIQLITSTFDINWPGAADAWFYLTEKIGNRVLPIIEHQLEIQHQLEIANNEDRDWIDLLNFIHRVIIENLEHPQKKVDTE